MRFPEAKAYRDARYDALPRVLLDWAPVDGAITVYDRACRGVQVRRTEDVLRGYIHRSFTLELDTLRESVGQIAIGALRASSSIARPRIAARRVPQSSTLTT